MPGIVESFSGTRKRRISQTAGFENRRDRLCGHGRLSIGPVQKQNGEWPVIFRFQYQVQSRVGLAFCKFCDSWWQIQNGRKRTQRPPKYGINFEQALSRDSGVALRVDLFQKPVAVAE